MDVLDSSAKELACFLPKERKRKNSQREMHSLFSVIFATCVSARYSKSSVILHGSCTVEVKNMIGGGRKSESTLE